MQVSYASAGNILWCRLPSGRFLTYPDPKLVMKETPWGEMKAAVSYMTVNNLTNQWERDYTYGGKLTENVTSGTARDLMCHGMLALERAGYPIILTVHDEIVTEPDESFGTLPEMIALMTDTPEWARGIPMEAEGFEAKRYKK
jgi:DNA polymerase